MSDLEKRKAPAGRQKGCKHSTTNSGGWQDYRAVRLDTRIGIRFRGQSKHRAAVKAAQLLGGNLAHQRADGLCVMWGPRPMSGKGYPIFQFRILTEQEYRQAEQIADEQRGHHD